MTNAEINQKISEGRELKPAPPRIAAELQFVSTGGAWVYTHDGWSPRDWTGSEDASALLFEEMPLAMVYRSDVGPWRCRSNHRSGDWAMLAADADRKTAIALAWLKWKGIA